MDWWLALLLAGVVAAATGPTISRARDPLLILSVLALDFIILAPLFATRYVVTITELRVRMGLFRLRLPRHRITRAYRRRGGATPPPRRKIRLNLALSLDGLVLDLKEGVIRQIVISPRDQEGFLRSLGLSPEP